MMKSRKIGSRTLAIVTFALALGVCSTPIMAEAAGSGDQAGQLGQNGGVRGDGTPVQAVVKMDGNPVAGVTVTFTAKKSVTAKTDDNGVASISLIPGHYTVTASNDSGSAKKTVNVPKSTTTTIVALTLAAAPAAKTP